MCCGSFNCDSLTQLVKLSAELCKVEAVHRDFRCVVGFRDAKVFTIKRDQIQSELSLLLLSFVVKNYIE